MIETDSLRLSLCMIVKDEEYFLDQCLSAAAIHVDEIIVVDTGSTDSTREIAARYTDKVFEFAWDDDFSNARNFSLAQAQGDWILVLDADEVISGPDLESMRVVIASSEMDGYFLIRRDYNNNALEGGWFSVQEDTPLSKGYRGYHKHPVCRVFRNRKDIRYRGRIHERVDWSLPEEVKGTLDVTIHHYVDDNPDKRRAARQLSYLDYMEQELEANPDGRLHAIAGATYLRFKEDYRRAIQHLRRAVELNYERNRNLESIAEAHYRLGELQPAYDTYLSLYKDGYKTPALCLNLANLSVKSADFGFAVDLLQQSMALGNFEPGLRTTIRKNIEHLRKKL